MNEHHDNQTSDNQRADTAYRTIGYHDLFRLEERMATESQVSQLSGILCTQTDMFSVDGPSLIGRAVAYTWPSPRFTFQGGYHESRNRNQVLTDWVADCAEEPAMLGLTPSYFRTAVENGAVPPEVPASGVSRIVLFSHIWTDPGRGVRINALRTVAQCLYVAGATDIGALVITPSVDNPYGCADLGLAEDLYQDLHIPEFTRKLRVVAGGSFAFRQTVERFGFDR